MVSLLPIMENFLPKLVHSLSATVRIFMLGVSVGRRISEFFALTVGNVYQNGKPVKDLLFLSRQVGPLTRVHAHKILEAAF